MLLVRRHHPPSTVSRRVGLGHVFRWLYFIFLRLRGGKVTCPRLRVQVGHVALQHDIHAVAASPSTWSTGFSLISLPRGVESYRSCFHHGCPVGIIWKTGHRMYGSGCQHWQFFLIRFLTFVLSQN